MAVDGCSGACPPDEGLLLSRVARLTESEDRAYRKAKACSLEGSVSDDPSLRDCSRLDGMFFAGHPSGRPFSEP
jgi:hypothetical protein